MNIDDHYQLYNDIEKIVFNLAYKESWKSILDEDTDKELENIMNKYKNI